MDQVPPIITIDPQQIPLPAEGFDVCALVHEITLQTARELGLESFITEPDLARVMGEGYSSREPDPRQALMQCLGLKDQWGLDFHGSDVILAIDKIHGALGMIQACIALDLSPDVWWDKAQGYLDELKQALAEVEEKIGLEKAELIDGQTAPLYRAVKARSARLVEKELFALPTHNALDDMNMGRSDAWAMALAIKQHLYEYQEWGPKLSPMRLSALFNRLLHLRHMGVAMRLLEAGRVEEAISWYCRGRHPSTGGEMENVARRKREIEQDLRTAQEPGRDSVRLQWIEHFRGIIAANNVLCASWLDPDSRITSPYALKRELLNQSGKIGSTSHYTFDLLRLPSRDPDHARTIEWICAELGQAHWLDEASDQVWNQVQVTTVAHSAQEIYARTGQILEHALRQEEISGNIVLTVSEKAVAQLLGDLPAQSAIDIQPYGRNCVVDLAVHQDFLLRLVLPACSTEEQAKAQLSRLEQAASHLQLKMENPNATDVASFSQCYYSRSSDTPLTPIADILEQGQTSLRTGCLHPDIEMRPALALPMERLSKVSPESHTYDYAPDILALYETGCCTDCGAIDLGLRLSPDLPGHVRAAQEDLTRRQALTAQEYFRIEQSIGDIRWTTSSGDPLSRVLLSATCMCIEGVQITDADLAASVERAAAAVQVQEPTPKLSTQLPQGAAATDDWELDSFTL